MNLYIDPLATVMHLHGSVQCAITGIVAVDPRAWLVLWARFEAIGAVMDPLVYIDPTGDDNPNAARYHHPSPDMVRSLPPRCVWGPVRILLVNPGDLAGTPVIGRLWDECNKPGVPPLTPERNPWTAAVEPTPGILTDNNGVKWRMEKVEE